jgi:hypothetical protein
MNKQIVSTNKRAGRGSASIPKPSGLAIPFGCPAKFPWIRRRTNWSNAMPRRRSGECFENLKAVITAAGATFDDVVKVNAYLTDLSHSGSSTKS